MDANGNIYAGAEVPALPGLDLASVKEDLANGKKRYICHKMYMVRLSLKSISILIFILNAKYGSLCAGVVQCLPQRQSL